MGEAIAVARGRAGRQDDAEFEMTRSPPMNVDEALRQFVDAEELPRAAMQWALDHWDEASPRFIAKLRAFAAGGNRTDAASDELFYIVHLCGEKHEERAYTPLCALIGEGEGACDFLGDGVTETLNGILINVCDGDPAPLKRAIEVRERRRIRARVGARSARLSRAREERARRRRNARLSQAIAPRNEAARRILHLGDLGGDRRQSRLRRSASRRRDFE